MSEILDLDTIPMNPIGGGQDDLAHQLGESFHDMGYGLGRGAGEELIHAGMKYIKDHLSDLHAGALGIVRGD